ncbi:aminoglycoside phosphotransferase family protein [Streptacidiphilus sp. PB12-B1b]|uniref:aminoglycoside phosphotransferase family protein n=1 Tax=Streptacidiphilus sp. PB12-B1b TaxID=2705012 RepID=UPI0015F93FB0|nr:aminoglycoside phosphotransferase family protein [Streptacidiphilus sp. PB12-B1b]QMU78211.1 aminoglycoside phosphotransferase family protein [Streptacidiphilus sp. PB12-B1b]
MSPHTGGAADAGIPLAHTVRRPWTDLPAEVRAAVEQRLGSRVTAAVDQTGGFSRGTAARLRCADGSRAFVKAVTREGDPFTVALAEREASVAAAFTPELGLPAPAFRGVVDQGGWLALLFDDIEGHIPAVPWRPDELALTLTALTALSERATPSPVPDLPVWGGALGEWHGWNRLLADEDPLADVPAWARRNSARLAAAEQWFPAATAGDTLLHSDLRSDNILVSGTEVTFVDWAWAARGQPWIDPMVFALCAAVQGHPDPQSVLLAHPAGRAADPAAVDSALAALAGRFVVSARQPATWQTAPVRAFQRAEAAACVRWLRARTGWS